MNSKYQAILFALITLVGIGVVATAVATPPSRFDPVGTQNIMGFIGALVTLLSAICTTLAIKRTNNNGSSDTGDSLESLKAGAVIILFPALASIAIVKGLLPTELVLTAIFFICGLLVIRVSSDNKFSRRTLGYLGVSGIILTLTVTQVFEKVLGLPLP